MSPEGKKDLKAIAATCPVQVSPLRKAASMSGMAKNPEVQALIREEEKES